ncbi:MAG: hypothetical protein WD851_08755 [Pirellulales bacterium]
MMKTLDKRLSRILKDPTSKDFILADAKDADMAFGLAAPGSTSANGHERLRSVVEYRQLMREIVEQALIDICLMSASSNEVLAIDKRLFENSPVTPAVRMNDSTDIWVPGNKTRYNQQASLPFSTVTIDEAMSGKLDSTPHERKRGADLGLYSLTFNNNAALDRATLQAYRDFRHEAERKGFRHFLEVFPPNAYVREEPEDVGRFLSDHIVRLLAGVSRKSRPVFLKVAYFGPAAMEALASYDPSLVVGIMGGSAGTTFDAFHLLWEAKKYGARAALFGRKINQAEHQPTFVRYLRALADGEIEPAEAVRSYHADIERAGLRPHRPLEQDLERAVPT